MKNPFPKLVVTEVANGTLTRGTHNLFLFTPEHELFRNPTAEQIRYAAKAINQHEALVEACRFAKAQIKRGAAKKALPILRLALLAEEETP